MNSRLLRALKREPVDKTPVWLMRQAGRYLPEYRQVRQKAGDFMTLCKTPDLACEVTLQPLERFDLDAAILFSDILTIPDAMGLGLYFTEGEGPKFKNPIRTKADVDKLKKPDPNDDLSYVMDAVRHIKRALNNKVPLIGFSGSPWTLATYMIEGGSTREFKIIKTLAYHEPELLHRVLTILAQSVTDYLNAQIYAGVDAVMVFDTWGGVLSPSAYGEFSLRYMTQIVEGLVRIYENKTIPVTLFTKNGHQWIEAIANTGCDAVGVDWTCDIGDIQTRVGGKVAIQGNMDPYILFSSPERIQQEVKMILDSFGPHPGHIFNLGHGINKDTPIENVKIFVDAVHRYSKK